MTNQEVYDKVKAHLLAQGKRSATPGGECKYRRPDGAKCAIGCLIPDELYNVNMEGKAVNSLILDDGAIASLFEGVDASLLETLQGIHDVSCVSRWQDSLERTAKDFGLNP